MRHRVVLASMLFLTASAASADVRLPAILSDGGVLQCDRPVAIWGWADAGEAITVDFAGASQSAVADGAGTWRVTLPPIAKGTAGELRGSGAPLGDGTVAGPFAVGLSSETIGTLTLPGDAGASLLVSPGAHSARPSLYLARFLRRDASGVPIFATARRGRSPRGSRQAVRHRQDVHRRRRHDVGPVGEQEGRDRPHDLRRQGDGVRPARERRVQAVRPARRAAGSPRGPRRAVAARSSRWA